MNDLGLQELVEKVVAELGERAVAEALERMSKDGSAKEEVLTIIANVGVHHLPDHLRRGEVFVASEGSLDFSTRDSVCSEITQVLTRVAAKLKEKNWSKIYLVPFGPTNLAMLIKLLVYRVTHIETIDIFYGGNGVYHDLDVALRPLVIEAG